MVAGDHEGPSPEVRALLATRGARAVRLGPLSLHTEDAVAVVSNELDRAGAAPLSPASPR